MFTRLSTSSMQGATRTKNNYKGPFHAINLCLKGALTPSLFYQKD